MSSKQPPDGVAFLQTYPMVSNINHLCSVLKAWLLSFLDILVETSVIVNLMFHFTCFDVETCWHCQSVDANLPTVEITAVKNKKNNLPRQKHHQEPSRDWDRTCKLDHRVIQAGAW